METFLLYHLDEGSGETGAAAGAGAAQVPGLQLPPKLHADFDDVYQLGRGGGEGGKSRGTNLPIGFVTMAAAIQDKPPNRNLCDCSMCVYVCAGRREYLPTSGRSRGWLKQEQEKERDFQGVPR